MIFGHNSVIGRMLNVVRFELCRGRDHCLSLFHAARGVHGRIEHHSGGERWTTFSAFVLVGKMYAFSVSFQCSLSDEHSDSALSAFNQFMSVVQ